MRRIFCVEGAWSENLADTESVLPLLHLLQGVGKIESIHRYVETREGLLNFLARWTQKKYAKWSIAYVAFHGSPGRLHLHDEELKLRNWRTPSAASAVTGSSTSVAAKSFA